MSVSLGPAVLTLDDITQQIRNTFEQFTDPRQGKNTRYTRVDAGLSAFSVFFMQSPSFLEYPRGLEQRLEKTTPRPCLGSTRSRRTIKAVICSTPLSRGK